MTMTMAGSSTITTPTPGPRRTPSLSSFFLRRKNPSLSHSRQSSAPAPAIASITGISFQNSWSQEGGELRDSPGEYWQRLASQDQHSPSLHHDGDAMECLDPIGGGGGSNGRGKEKERWDWMDLKSWESEEGWEREGRVQVAPDSRRSEEGHYRDATSIQIHQRSFSLDSPLSTSSSFSTPNRNHSHNLTMTPLTPLRPSFPSTPHTTPTSTATPSSPSSITPRPTTPLHRTSSLVSLLSPKKSTKSPKAAVRSLSLRITTVFDGEGRKVLSSTRSRRRNSTIVERERREGEEESEIEREEREESTPLPTRRLKKQFGIGDDSSDDEDEDEDRTNPNSEETLLSTSSSEDECHSLYSPTASSPIFSTHASSTSLSSFSRTSSLSRTISSTSASSQGHLVRKLTPPTGPPTSPSTSTARVLRRRSEAFTNRLSMGIASEGVLGIGGGVGIRRSASQTDYGGMKNWEYGRGTKKEWEEKREKEKERENVGRRGWEPDDKEDYMFLRPQLRIANPDLLPSLPSPLPSNSPLLMTPLTPAFSISSSPPTVLIRSESARAKLQKPDTHVFVGWAI